MNVSRFVSHVKYSLAGALVLISFSASPALAQHDAHSAAEKSYGHRDKTNSQLVKAVREATERYKDVAQAEAAGYKLMFGCVTGDSEGAMGLHYVKLPLVLDPKFDPSEPEILLYEPTSNGRLRLTGADFLVFADTWHAQNPDSTPQIMGQLLHRFEAPNRFGLPAFYTLHVWAWKESPTGTFVNWHANVSCDGFNPQE
jgi:hypothetical protein